LARSFRSCEVAYQVVELRRVLPEDQVAAALDGAEVAYFSTGNTLPVTSRLVAAGGGVRRDSNWLFCAERAALRTEELAD
jgi:hypothetical protein